MKVPGRCPAPVGVTHHARNQTFDAAAGGEHQQLESRWSPATVLHQLQIAVGAGRRGEAVMKRLSSQEVSVGWAGPASSLGRGIYRTA